MKAKITEFPASQEIYPDKVVILGTEIEADFCEADLYDRFEKIRQGLENHKPMSTDNVGDVIREECELVFECFDELFGDGTAYTIFGGRTNLRLCIQAFIELSTQANGQIAAVKNTVDAAVPNRAQRRLLNNG